MIVNAKNSEDDYASSSILVKALKKVSSLSLFFIFFLSTVSSYSSKGKTRQETDLIPQRWKFFEFFKPLLRNNCH